MNNQPQIYIGTSGWIYEHWRGLFYPADLPQKRWFDYYTTCFSAVEINATFYRTFKDQTYLNWREKAPPGFRYVLKAPRLITHRKYLEDVEAEITRFWQSASLLGERLGLILLQLAPATPYDPERLRKALRAFEDPGRVAVEFRRREWFNEEIYQLLREVGAVFCNADSPKTALNDWLTSETAYLRLHGRKRWYSYNYSPEELSQIAALVQEMIHKGAHAVYVFFNNDFEGYAPQNALTLMHLLQPGR
jgi:uncharacterized protein YecE (DUF72 family)